MPIGGHLAGNKTGRKDRKKVFVVMVTFVFVVVAILGYALEPKKEPLRVAFDTKGGGVIFDHQMHATLDNTKCQGCHHNADEGENDFAAMNCRGCHYSEEYKEACEENPIHKRCIAKNCDSCHVKDSVTTCKFCHNSENFEPIPEPKTVEFDTEGGRVVFDHFKHASADGYEVECETCHHGFKPENKKAFPMNCRRCHYNKNYNSVCEKQETHVRCIGKNCMDCHEDGAEDCEICHKE